MLAKLIDKSETILNLKTNNEKKIKLFTSSNIYNCACRISSRFSDCEHHKLFVDKQNKNIDTYLMKKKM